MPSPAISTTRVAVAGLGAIGIRSCCASGGGAGGPFKIDAIIAGLLKRLPKSGNGRLVEAISSPEIA